MSEVLFTNHVAIASYLQRELLFGPGMLAISSKPETAAKRVLGDDLSASGVPENVRAKFGALTQLET